MSPKTPRFTAHEVETLLRNKGFRLVSQRGSHRKWRHDGKNLQVIVPEHANRPLPIGTLLSILRTAEIDMEQD
jgi:predicted RNA binding protein YcfA (HicA-like mRNA interferase family)